MVRIVCVVLIACTVALGVFGVVTLYDETMQVGRMWETPAVRPYEQPIPEMANLSVPFSGGELFYRTADPETLRPSFALNAQLVIAKGKIGYQYYCVQCHGSKLDGYGTVGQSFAPPPGDLRSTRVQNFSAGRLFHEISYGIPGGRQPALATTIEPDVRWQIIGYVKSLGVRP